MNRLRVFGCMGLALTTGLVLTACSMGTVMWGAEGARVIEVTDQFVQKVTAGEPIPGACADTALEIGDRQRWAGLSAGEPERLTGEFWEEQQALGATWAINLEGLDISTAENGGSYPSYVFFSDTGDELCIIDIERGTVTF